MLTWNKLGSRGGSARKTNIERREKKIEGALSRGAEDVVGEGKEEEVCEQQQFPVFILQATLAPCSSKGVSWQLANSEERSQHTEQMTKKTNPTPKDESWKRRLMIGQKK